MKSYSFHREKPSLSHALNHNMCCLSLCSASSHLGVGWMPLNVSPNSTSLWFLDLWLQPASGSSQRSTRISSPRPDRHLEMFSSYFKQTVSLRRHFSVIAFQPLAEPAEDTIMCHHDLSSVAFPFISFTTTCYPEQHMNLDGSGLPPLYPCFTFDFSQKRTNAF